MHNRQTHLASALAGLALLATTPMHAQTNSTIPATAPTTAPATTPSPAPQPTVAEPAVVEPQSTATPHVTWTGAILSIDARGASLLNILRDVNRQTGMKVTGGVPNERVFGLYGPGSANQVIGDLLKGMTVNVLLVNGDAVAPKELILTARQGGVTPPSPTVPFADGSSQDQDRIRREDVNTFAVPPQRGAVPPPAFGRTGNLNSERSLEADDTANDRRSSAPAQSTQPDVRPESPNGTRTPEQIFEELRRRQAQQQQQTR